MMANESNPVVIVGNSGFAREVHIMLRKMMLQDSSILLRGFLSFEGYPGDLKELGSMLLGHDDEYAFAAGEKAVIAIGDPHLRQKAHVKLRAQNVRLFNVIHPEAYIDASSSIGEGNIFGARCYVTCNSSIGDGNVFNGMIHVGHDCVIGDYNFLGPGTQVLGDVRIGSLNAIGATSVLLPRATIGNGNKIAPLSAVYKGCRDNVYLAGNPSVKIGKWDGTDDSRMKG